MPPFEMAFVRRPRASERVAFAERVFKKGVEEVCHRFCVCSVTLLLGAFFLSCYEGLRAAFGVQIIRERDPSCEGLNGEV